MKISYPNLLLTFFLCYSGLSFSQDTCMRIGTNFHFFDAGVYKDLKRSSTHFFTRNSIYQGDGNDWDSGLAETMAQDDEGYPLALPFAHPVTGHDQIAAFTIGGYQRNYQAGDYVLLYEGTGSIVFVNWTAATVTSAQPGRIEFSIDSVNEHGIHIEIHQSTSGNHIRNIRIVQTIYEHNVENCPYLPEFEEKVMEFENLRFMDWVFTNNQPDSNWQQRIQPGFHSQNLDNKGLAWEHIIELCNYYEKDLWINLPHLAKTDYIDSLAILFRDELDPDLTIYLEYSNECWNWIFDQTHWLNETGPFVGQIGKNYGYYSHIVFDRWESLFAGQEDRLKPVLAGHDYFVLDALDYFDGQGATDLVDLVSYPGYVALNPSDYDTLSLYGAAATAEQVINLLRANMDSSFYWMQQFKSLVSDSYGKDFVMYEGGQHLTPEWFGLDTNYNHALYAAQTHPDMYVFYQDMLDYYKDSLGITLFMNYVLASEQESAFGSWGLLSSYFEMAPYPPKWNAVMDWKVSHACDSMATSVSPMHEAHGIQLYPNPSTSGVYIEGIQLDHPVEIVVYDLQGRFVGKWAHTDFIDVSAWNAGLYIFQIQQGEKRVSLRFLKVLD